MSAQSTSKAGRSKQPSVCYRCGNMGVMFKGLRLHQKTIGNF